MPLLSNVKNVKSIKDSVHGYIEIEEDYMRCFVDSSLFQRLGRIEQTSMRVLYPSARHDRFIHSIGTFYLGKKAFHYFKENFLNDNFLDIIDEEWDIWRKSFEIACLLHDIGHAPFSHTCEDFFNEIQVDFTNSSGSKAKISSILFQLLNEMKDVLTEEEYKEFLFDYGLEDEQLQNREVSPSPHEIVSSIVILRCYSNAITNMKADINLIIRCIIGCTYSETLSKKGIKNCIIRMLNSPVIDVDKLDYITRDSNLTGFSNANIDTERLLKSFTAFKESGDDFYPAYNKSSLSVIQNVISANNAQLAWIVNHHAVVYNSYLIQSIINEISRKIHPENPAHFRQELFSVDSIIGTKDCCNVFKVNMLSDDDLWHLFKLYMNEIPKVRELLERTSRKKALWKSFAEFSLLFDENKTEYKNGDFDFKKFKEMFAACCDDAKEFGYHIFDRAKAESLDKKVSKAGLDFCEIIIEFAKYKSLNIDGFVILAGGNPSKKKAVISRNKLRIKFYSGQDGTKRYDKVMKLLIQGDTENNETNKNPYFFLFHSSEIDKIQFCNFFKSHRKLKYIETT